MTTKKLIVVLGMHRSGTSALTRGLAALSVQLGGNLMPAAKGVNEKGFWEDLDIYRLNERILRKLGTSWHNLSCVDIDRIADHGFSEERSEAIDLLNQKTHKNGAFAFKDPRTAILLPFWQSVFKQVKISEYYLVSVRNPLEVAQSLLKRDSMDSVKGVVLWAKHVASILQYTEGKKRLFVSYSALMASPDRQLERIASAFSLPMPPSDTIAFKEYVTEFLDDSLRNHKFANEELIASNVVPDDIKRLYKIVDEWSKLSPHSNATMKPEDVRRTEDYLRCVEPLCQYADRLSETLSRQRTLNAELQITNRKLEEENRINSARQLEELRQTKETIVQLRAERDKTKVRFQSHIETIERDCDARVKEIESTYKSRFRAKLQGWDAERSELELQHAFRLDRQRAEMNDVLESFQQKSAVELCTLKREIHDRESQVQSNNERYQSQIQTLKSQELSLSLKLKRVLRQTGIREVELDRLRKELLDLRNSTSWRVTAPFRFVSALLKR